MAKTTADAWDVAATVPSSATAVSTTATDTNLSTTTVTNPVRTSLSATLTYDRDAASVISGLPSIGWAAQCATAVLYDYAVATAVADIRFVDMNGIATNRSLDGDTWGISYDQCQHSCGEVGINFDFNFFSNAMTSYLLPWLALCAQLPYETRTQLRSAMSFALIVGSPALAAYSLLLTVFSRRRIADKVKTLKSEVSTTAGERLDKIKIVLEQAQQAPLQIPTAVQDYGELRKVLADPDSVCDKWWTRATKSLERTYRGSTASLWAQLIVALVSYLFTVIASLASQLGDHDTLLEISNGGLWLWLLTIVPAWVYIGVQNGAGTVESALEEPMNQDERLGFRLFLRPEKPHHNKIAGWEGPMFNFARIINFQWQVDTIFDAWKEGRQQTAAQIPQQTPFSQSRGRSARRQDEDAAAETNSALAPNTHHETRPPPRATLAPPPPVTRPSSQRSRDSSRRSGDSAESHQLSERSEATPLTDSSTPLTYPQIDGWLLRRMLAAAALGLFLQWGTTGSSFLLAYETFTIGLGCRSFSYAIYGVLGTLVLVLMAPVEPLFVHAARLQRMMNPPEASQSNSKYRTRYQTWFAKARLRTVRHMATVMSVLGCSIAIVNAGVLIAVSFLEPIGAFNMCYCQATELQLGPNGWVVLFKTPSQLASFEVSSTVGAFLMGLLVWFLVLAFAIAALNKRAD